MEKKRKNYRYQVRNEVVGSFNNREKFLLKDFNPEGLQLVAGFSPLEGSRYKLKIHDYQRDLVLDVQVVRVTPGEFNLDEKSPLPVGTTYTLGVRILDITEDNLQFLKSLIYH